MKRSLSLFAGYFFFSTLFFYFSCIQTYKPTGLACRTDPDCWGEKDHFCDLSKNVCALLSEKSDEATNIPDEPTPPEKAGDICYEAPPPKQNPTWPHQTFNCKTFDFCKPQTTCVAASVGPPGPGKPFNDFGACACSSCPADCPAPFFRCAKVIDESVSPSLTYFEGKEVCMKSCDTDADCPAEMACSRLVNAGKICISLELMGVKDVLTKPCQAASDCPGSSVQMSCCGLATFKECRSAFVIQKSGIPCL